MELLDIKNLNKKYDDKNVLKEMNVYEEMYKQPSRKNCALLPIEAFEYIIKEIK